MFHVSITVKRHDSGVKRPKFMRLCTCVGKVGGWWLVERLYAAQRTKSTLPERIRAPLRRWFEVLQVTSVPRESGGKGVSPKRELKRKTTTMTLETHSF